MVPIERAERRERHAPGYATPAPPLALRAEFIGAGFLLHDRRAAFGRRSCGPQIETHQRDRSRGGEDQRGLEVIVVSPGYACRASVCDAGGEEVAQLQRCISMAKFH